jgi:hypothetical protein
MLCKSRIHNLKLHFFRDSSAYASPETSTVSNALSSEWPRIIQISPRSLNTSSEKSYQSLRRWLSGCLDNHTRCSKGTVTNLPKRILEICDDHVYLRESEDSQGKYACLSHCWGKQGASLQLNSGTIQMLKDGIMKQQLPKTFADAIEVSKALEIRYLWIDAMCKLE